jgi:hypothetical protein
MYLPALFQKPQIGLWALKSPTTTRFEFEKLLEIKLKKSCPLLLPFGLYKLITVTSIYASHNFTPIASMP